jgi:hypothetical protein
MFVLCFRFSRPCLFNDKWLWVLTFVYKPVKLINYLSVCRAWWTKSGPKIRSVYITGLFSYCLNWTYSGLEKEMGEKSRLRQADGCTMNAPRGSCAFLLNLNHLQALTPPTQWVICWWRIWFEALKPIAFAYINMGKFGDTWWFSAIPFNTI